MPGTDKHHHKNNWAPAHWGLGEIDGLLVPPMGRGLGEIDGLLVPPGGTSSPSISPRPQWAGAQLFYAGKASNY